MSLFGCKRQLLLDRLYFCVSKNGSRYCSSIPTHTLSSLHHFTLPICTIHQTSKENHLYHPENLTSTSNLQRKAAVQAGKKRHKYWKYLRKYLLYCPTPGPWAMNPAFLFFLLPLPATLLISYYFATYKIFQQKLLLFIAACNQLKLYKEKKTLINWEFTFPTSIDISKGAPTKPPSFSKLFYAY